MRDDTETAFAGAGSGLGRAIASTFAKQGAVVVATDINKKAAQATIEQLTQGARH